MGINWFGRFNLLKIILKYREAFFSNLIFPTVSVSKTAGRLKLFCLEDILFLSRYSCLKKCQI